MPTGSCVYINFTILRFTSDAVRTDPHGNKYIEKECELKQWCHNCFTKKGEPDLTMTSYNCKRSPWLNTSPDKGTMFFW